MIQPHPQTDRGDDTGDRYIEASQNPIHIIIKTIHLSIFKKPLRPGNEIADFFEYNKMLLFFVRQHF